MYTDKDLLNMLTHPSKDIKNTFFEHMECDSCPLNIKHCHGHADLCEQDIREYLYDKGVLSAEAGEPTAEPTPTENEPAAAPKEEEMSMRELTNLRREINRKYIKARDKAFAEMVEEMYKTGKFYTAEDLSDMSGLSINTISKIFRYYRNYNNNLFFGGYRFETKKTWLRTPFVRLLPTGEVDMSRHNDQCREVLSYKIVKR
jgi:hypothetical protein